MKNLIPLCIGLLLLPIAASATGNDTLRYQDYGRIIVYKPKLVPESLVLFISGEGGWKQGVSDMARQLASEGAMVAAIDIRIYLKNLGKSHGKCDYPAGDFESLSLYLQKKYAIRNYMKPILAGYSSGATLAYGILAQAPANTFKGAISIGFCPDLAIPKPLCEGSGLKLRALKSLNDWHLEPTDKLTAPFIVLNGAKDKIYASKDLETYVKGIPFGELVYIPDAGHEITDTKTWVLPLTKAYDKINASPSYPERIAGKNQLPKQAVEKVKTDLPLVIVPAVKNDTMPMLFFISGDGGWTSFDEGVAEKLAEKGIPVVGLDAQKYFWQPRTPDKTASEIANVIQYYTAAWNKKSFILCGYSFGADVVPFMLTRLPADLKPTLKSAVMMSPDTKADFEIHVADMLNFGSNSDKYDVVAELRKNSRKNVVCIFGQEEGTQSQKLFQAAGAGLKLIPGDHHYGSDYNAIAREIINSLK